MQGRSGPFAAVVVLLETIRDLSSLDSPHQIYSTVAVIHKTTKVIVTGGLELFARSPVFVRPEHRLRDHTDLKTVHRRSVRTPTMGASGPTAPLIKCRAVQRGIGTSPRPVIRRGEAINGGQMNPVSNWSLSVATSDDS